METTMEVREHSSLTELESCSTFTCGSAFLQLAASAVFTLATVLTIAYLLSEGSAGFPPSEGLETIDTRDESSERTLKIAGDKKARRKFEFTIPKVPNGSSTESFQDDDIRFNGRMHSNTERELIISSATITQSRGVPYGTTVVQSTSTRIPTPGENLTQGATKMTETADTPGKSKHLTTLLCTYELHLTQYTRTIEDGVCDYIFYASAYFRGQDRFGQEPSTSLTAFIKHARHSSKTQFGLAVSARSLRAAYDFMQSTKATPYFDDLFQSKIHHFGVLDARTNSNFTEETTADLLHVFQAFRKIQMLHGQIFKEATGEPLLALGIAFVGERQSELFPSIASVVRETATNIVILRTHHSYLDRKRGVKECVISAPTVWTGAPKYQPAIADVLQFMQERQFQLSRSTLMISFGLFVQAYGALGNRDGPNDVRFGSPCNAKRSWLYPYITICNDDAIQASASLDFKRQAWRAYHTDWKEVVAYDSEDTILQKICWSLQTQTVLSGIALFMLEDEVSTVGHCQASWTRQGNFSRVRAVRRLLDDVKERSPDFPFVNCWF